LNGPAPIELADGLWSWSTRHPEWHPGDFGSEVVSFAARTSEALLLVDPQLPAEESATVLALLDSEATAAGRIAILITIPYHVRSAEPLWERYRAGQEVSVHGHAAARKRLRAAVGAFSPIEPGRELPGGVIPYAIGRPQRYESPLHLPAHDALIFGDAVVGVDDRLRVWSDRRIDEDVLRFYRERFNPTLEPLVAIAANRMLMTHGPSVLESGTEALREALAAPPWYHRP
jgi:hypothetical protein